MNRPKTRQIRSAPVHSSPKLPKSVFGELVGSLDHISAGAHNNPKPDDNHLYVWLSVASGKFKGRYECAVNTQSAEGHAAAMYCQRDLDIQPADIPTAGFLAGAKLSYKDLGLKDADFVAIPQATLQPLVIHWSQQASSIAAYGMTYTGGDGLHDVHMNSGNDPNSGFPDFLPGEDGAVCFYLRRKDGTALAQWLFLKFQTQHIG
jgi:Uncharacterized conserved protein (DUF2278)